MELLLHREDCTIRRTIGRLWIDGQFECFTLEDAIHEVKIPKQTCIPAGRYEIVLDFSMRFQKILPRLLNVPDFIGIRIHSGNGPDDTEGCILVGQSRDADMVLQSRAAMAKLLPQLAAALGEDERIWITITNPEPHGRV